MAELYISASLDSGEKVELSFDNVDTEELARVIKYTSNLFGIRSLKTRAPDPVPMYLVRKRRKDIGWSQSDLAGLLDVSIAQVSMMESGKRLPSIDVNDKLKNFLKGETDERID